MCHRLYKDYLIRHIYSKTYRHLTATDYKEFVKSQKEESNREFNSCLEIAKLHENNPLYCYEEHLGLNNLETNKKLVSSYEQLLETQHDDSGLVFYNDNDDKLRHFSHILCEHSLAALDASFKKTILNNKSDNWQGLNSNTQPSTCEVNSFQNWRYTRDYINHGKGGAYGGDIAYLRYGNKIYINQDINYNYLKDLTNPSINMCQSMHTTLQGDHNNITLDEILAAYTKASELPYDPTIQAFEGKCFLVTASTNKSTTLKNLTKQNEKEKCNVKRVGVEYIKLQEFFGGLKANFCHIQGDHQYRQSRKKQIEDKFIHKIKESRSRFSEYNPGLIRLPPSENDSEKSYSKNVRKNVYNDFEGPIKSIKLTHVNGSNKSTYLASIDGANRCVIKSLNRYIHKTIQPQDPLFLRLMINEMHFEEDSCSVEGKNYLTKLKELEADDDPENNKKSGDNIEIKYVDL